MRAIHTNMKQITRLCEQQYKKLGTDHSVRNLNYKISHNFISYIQSRNIIINKV